MTYSIISWKVRNIFLSTLTAITCISGLSSCSRSVHSNRVSGMTIDLCKPVASEDYQDTLASTINNSFLDSILSTKFSRREIMISHAAGIYNDLTGIVIRNQDTLQHLLILQRITGKITLINMEIQAVVGNLDCNSDRIKTLADYLDNINTTNTKKLTIGSVTVGALSVIGTAAIKNNPWNTIVGVGGGLISAGLAALTISPKGKNVDLPLQNIYLSNVWLLRNDSNSFPPFVWTMLHEKGIHDPNSSVAENIRSRWIMYQFNGQISPADEKKFFLTGGSFTAGNLHTLENMINELQAMVMSFHQDLKSLIIKLYSFRPKNLN